MSLTRAEWVEMWEDIKDIERDSDYLYFRRREVADRIKQRCQRVKEKIQQVIGQME